jgi:hypothetical protein
MLQTPNFDLSPHVCAMFLCAISSPVPTLRFCVFDLSLCSVSVVSARGTSGRACRPVDWQLLHTLGSRGRARRSLPKHGTRTSTIFMGDSPPWANLASFPPIGGTPTGFQRGRALGTAKREAGSGGGASPYPRSFALLPVSGRSNRARARYRARSSFVLGDLVKRDGKMERKSTRKARRCGMREGSG